ncbi:MAG: hypothetical protein ACI3W8_05765 [Oscillospiraceae bacterium]
MIRPFEQALRRYGQPVTVCHEGEETQVRAFLQEKLEKNEEPPRSVTPLGVVDRRRWIYIGPAETALSVGDRVLFGGESFIAQQAEPVWLGGEICHWWAQLKKEKEAAQ